MHPKDWSGTDGLTIGGKAAGTAQAKQTEVPRDTKKVPVVSEQKTFTPHTKAGRSLLCLFPWWAKSSASHFSTSCLAAELLSTVLGKTAS